MNILFTILIAALAVALMILGLAITLIRRGKPLQSDIGDNDAMRERGIVCAAAQMRAEEAQFMGRDVDLARGCGKGECGSCAVEETCEE